MQPDSGLVVSSSELGVVTIRMNRPERLNALGVVMTDALCEAVEGAIRDNARVIVLRGTGRAFCVGADLKERREMEHEARWKHNRAINAAGNALAAAPIPTIALINGFAVGGGCELALACDLRYAAEDAQIGLTEARVGVFPGAGGSQRLPRVVGAARALELMLLADPISAKRAEQIGLIHAAFPADQLEERVMAIANVLTARSRWGVKTLKNLVYRGFELPLAEALVLEGSAARESLNSPDYKEGLEAFAEKRAPRFA